MDLYENVAIIGKDLKLIYVGKSLAELLKQNEIELDNLSPNNNSSKNLSLITGVIPKLLSTKEPQFIKLSPTLELITFLANDGESIFIGLKEKVIRIQTIAHQLKERVKEIIGTCQSMGILVEGMPAQEAMRAIENGTFDDKIKSGKTELTAEEKQHLEQEKKKLQQDLEKRRKEFEVRAKDILKEFEKDPKKARKAMSEAGIPDKIINELAPAEEKKK